MPTKRFAVLFLAGGLLFGVALLISRAQPSPAMGKGVSYLAWLPGEYTEPEADLALTQLASTGANWISITTGGFGYLGSRRSALVLASGLWQRPILLAGILDTALRSGWSAVGLLLRPERA